MRLNKLIAERGIASRREADRLVAEGQVTVNGKLVDQPGLDVDPDGDHVKVRGKLLPSAPVPLHMALHKPPGCLTTDHDPEDRPTIFDLLEGTRYRHAVEPVGRLDYGSEGLLLLTNDGDLAHRLTHPRYHVPKTYMAKVTGDVTDRKLKTLRKGVPLPDGRTSPALVEIVEARQRNTWVKLTIREGRNRVVRRMMEFLGHRVLKLKRVRFGGVRLGDLPRGELRRLTGEEVANLRAMVAGEGKEEFEAALARQERTRRRPTAAESRQRRKGPRRGPTRGGRRGRKRSG